MSYPDIRELSNAYTLCLCPENGCARSCTVCSATTWEKGPCVRQLWNAHAASDTGKAAARRFDEMVREVGTVPYVTGPSTDPEVLSDAEIVERTIDFTEAMGMYLEPWQAAALRAIMLHGGDVAIVRGGRGY